MIVFRFLALILFALALMLLGGDALDSLEAGEVSLRSLSDFAELIGLGNWQAGVEGLESWPAWLTGALLYVVTSPAWAVLGLTSIVLSFIFAPRAREE